MLSKNELNDQFDVYLNYFMYLCRKYEEVFKKVHKAGKPFLGDIDHALTASINRYLASVRQNPTVNFKNFQEKT